MATHKMTGPDFADAFSSLINTFQRDQHDAAVARMVVDHRSIQQGYMRFFMLFVEKLATNRTDQRNEAAVALAKAIMALPEAQQRLPLI